MPHANAPLTPEGRRRLCERIDEGRPIAHVAAEGGVSRAMLSKWYGRSYVSEEARTAALADFLNYYNHERPHSALGYKPPVSRVPLTDYRVRPQPPSLAPADADEFEGQGTLFPY